MADYALDQVWDMEDLRFSYRMGDMSTQRAYDLGIVDEMGGEHYVPLFKKAKSPPRCKHCGSMQVKWKQFPDGKWRLTESSGRVHTCKQYSQSERKTNGIGSDGFC